MKNTLFVLIFLGLMCEAWGKTKRMSYDSRPVS
jgi:hypothetical protein